jgi:hypothetical protein
MGRPEATERMEGWAQARIGESGSLRENGLGTHNTVHNLLKEGMGALGRGLLGRFGQKLTVLGLFLNLL